MNRRQFLSASAGLAAVTAGCSGDDDAGSGDGAVDLPQEATIEIADGAFDPRTVQIAVGGTVTWTNEGDEDYRVDAFQFHTDSKSWSYRETLEPGTSTSQTFEEEGLYDFTDQGRGQFSMCGRVRVGDVDEGKALPCE